MIRFRSRRMSRCKALVSTLSTRPARMRAKWASVARVSRSRNTSFSPSNSRAARTSSVMNTAAAVRTLVARRRSICRISVVPSAENAKLRLARLARFAATPRSTMSPACSRLVMNARISDRRRSSSASSGFVVERGQIGLHRAVQAIEHVVEPLGFGDALAVAAVERLERASQHGFERRRPCATPRARRRRVPPRGFRGRRHRDRPGATDRSGPRAPARSAAAAGRAAAAAGRTAPPSPG